VNLETIAITITALSAALTAVLAFIIFRMRTDTGSAGADPATSERMERMSHDLATERVAMNGKLDQVDTKLANLQQTVDQREGALNAQVTGLDAAMRNVVGLFTNDRRRGSWGELTLKRIFEAAGMTENRDYTLQFTDGDKRPDVVVHIPGGRSIVIDSKFPTTRYLEAMAIEDRDERQTVMAAHGKELEAVGKSLVKKHYADNACAGYVIVFVPSQSVYEAAAAAHPGVVERLMQQGVIIAGPVNVFALIKTAGTLMAEHRAVKDAREIVGEVRELRSRLGVFADHFERVGKGLNTAVKAFNSAIGSWNSRLSPSVNRIAEMSGTDELSYLAETNEAVAATAPNALKEAV